MTLITFQGGKVVMKADKVGTEQGCCCEDSCPCEQPGESTELPTDTPVSISTDCLCVNGDSISATGTLDNLAWSNCGQATSFGVLQIGFCGSRLFVSLGAAWQGAQAGPLFPSGRSYGNFVGCPANDVTESGGTYSGTITLIMDVLTDAGDPSGQTPSTCEVTITLG